MTSNYTKGNVEEARKLAIKVQEQNPELKIGYEADGASIAAWYEAEKRWVRQIFWAITGQWVQTGHDYLVNGQPVPGEFIAVREAIA